APAAPSLSPSQARIQSFRVVPYLPDALKPLMEIAQNLWWTWNHPAVSLFARLDRDLWESTEHNPVKMLGSISQEKLDRAAADRSFLHAVSSVHAQLQEHLAHKPWFGSAAVAASGTARPFKVAYFCAEFGITECFQIYSGGLGGLAGDHLKSAAELNIPLIAVGLLYRKGYFHQYLNADGYQQELYPDIDPPNQPVHRVPDPKGTGQLKVRVELPGRSVAIAVWRADVGRVPLYLLDTNLPENSREDRDITRNLYGGDMETRIKQEIVLGIGGVKALAALGEEPTVFHINEGHAALLALERITRLREKTNLTFDQVREAVASSQVFTTHTPVPAGIDRFPPRLIEQYFSHMLPGLGLDTEGLLALGRENTGDKNEFFSMAVLALRTSRYCNGVSELHGAVSRGMWKNMWPGVPEHEVPIAHVTNGVHIRTWLSADMTRLFDRSMGDRWRTDPHDPQVWKPLDEVPDAELWAVKNRRREKLINWCRRRIRQQLVARGAGAIEIERAASALDANTFTIGFARRFATYKRGTLLFRDAERLLSIIRDAHKPVQIIIAGKSHPADGGGKALIRDIVDFIRKHNVQHRVVFLEDYDMHTCRRMVQGCDIWLNTPIRGLEASGTSGMKAAMNGCIHTSILDGWWCEGFDPDSGFAIGRGEHYDDSQRDAMDDIESRALYQTLQSQIVQEFYDRDDAGLPRKWIARMRRCIKANAPRFTTHRMLRDYANFAYIPAHQIANRLNDNNLAEAGELSNHIDRYRQHWHEIRIEHVNSQVATVGSVSVRSMVRVMARVHLGALSPTEVQAQLFHGSLNSLGEMITGSSVVMQHAEQLQDGAHLFVGAFAPDVSGQHGYSVRILPNDNRLATPFLPGLITWDNHAEHHAEALTTA
ncbi:MAG: alpha-glucan family phosphorylase, partial [Phycisphaerales bacterium]|nr:alpha-glucan family phosphorylase [Phycisphaerales bacterium]